MTLEQYTVAYWRASIAANKARRAGTHDEEAASTLADIWLVKPSYGLAQAAGDALADLYDVPEAKTSAVL
jgi:hypothetical protein